MPGRFLRRFRVVSFIGLLGSAAGYATVSIVHLAAGHDDHPRTDLYIVFTLGILACLVLAPGSYRERQPARPAGLRRERKVGVLFKICQFINVRRGTTVREDSPHD